MAEVLADSPLGYWKMDEAVGATTAVDSSGNGQDATYTGATVTTGERQLLGDYSGSGAAARFVSAGRAEIAAAVWHEMSGSFTYECWHRRVTDPAASTFPGIFRRGATGAGGAVLYYNSGRDITYNRDGTGRVSSLVGAQVNSADLGRAQHIVLRYDLAATKLALFLNGSELATWRTVTDTFAAPVSAVLQIGGDSGAAGNDQWVDEVALYGTALPDARVLAHYQAGISSPPPNRLNLR